MDSAAKQRNPRNREWERQRRNKFNDAIAKLGDLVKAINKANNASSEEDNAQYPKIEIIQKAIVCLTSYAQEKTQLKAEILALQVKLDGEKSNTADKKDASTQVYIAINRKKKNGKVVKIVMLDKSSNKNNKNKSKSISETKTANVPQKLPMLLPRTTINNKKGTENAIVVLPAAPYIFPQRPFLVPAAPPAIVLVDPNLQALSKPSVPIVSRNNGDITKTTMVNILPISAYSGPLSAIKNKKHSVRLKSDINKKINKKIKTSEKLKAVSVNATNKPDRSNKLKESNTVENESISKDLQLQESKTDEKESTPKKITTKVTPEISNPELDNHQNTDSISNNKDIITIEKSSVEVPKTMEESKPPNIDIENSSSTTTVNTSPTVDTKMKTEDNKTNKLSSSKEPLTEIINEKDNKIPNILDQPLCDSAVDGGNARLELAEEFLAASPTAAFLMSFPLVSGNRADSPAEEPTTAQSNSKDTIARRNDVTNQQGSYFEKHVPHDSKGKANNQTNAAMVDHKSNEQMKCVTSLANKLSPPKISSTIHNTNATSENPFLNLPMPSLIPASCTISDSTLGLDFDCNINKPMPSQATSFANSSNLFYKNDPFSTVKSTIYSTSSISGNHDFNSLGLYPCAMEKYTPKNKSEYANMEDNLMKMGSSRLTYDIDLGWSHKSFDFVNCTTASNTFTKDSILPTSSISYSSSYNPFNPEFHVPLVSNPSKKDNTSSKPTSTFTETIASFYSQATNLWPEDVPFYSSSNINTSSSKHKNYLSFDHSTINTQPRANASKSYDLKDTSGTQSAPAAKSTNMSGHGISEKYTKKSSNKMHINWMTSEIRPLQTSCNPTLPEIKEIHKSSFNNVNHKVSYNNLDNMNKKQELNEGNYFPISMHNYPTQVTQEEFQAWPSARPLGTAEVSIEPPPINLPTLVGDLALGPHDKKKSVDPINRPIAHNDAQNCGNFLSVTQIMNRSTDNTRYAATNVDVSKSIPTKQNVSNFTNDHARKGFTSSRMENNPTEPYYVLNDSKIVHSYDNIPQYPQAKLKLNSKTEKNVKSQKNNYSAEALIRTGNCTQKVQDSNSSKFMMASQKYNDFTPQDSSVAQVSHYPPILDYSENVYVTQQFSGTTLYNSTTNTISNSFYSNFMPGTSNLITSNYTAGPFTGDFIDYNQSTECNYTNHKYEDLKMRNNPMVCVPEKGSSYKSSRREATKHKLECKKESNKKVQNKRTKLSTEVEEWCDPNLMLWQNKSASKRHPNLMSEELPFPNYVGNQMPTQYQPDFFNSHLMTSNMQNMGHSVDRSLATLPVTSRANFNLSTIFPEITMKVQ